jgi:beta-lysine N6-acetyltransferase
MQENKKAWDVTEFLDGAWIKARVDLFSKRIRLDDYRGNLKTIFMQLEQWMNLYGLEKLIIKAKVNNWEWFLSQGFALEGIYKNYFSGADAFALVKYFSQERKNSEEWLKEELILHDVLKLERDHLPADLHKEYTIKLAERGDAKGLAELYDVTFPVYPTPLNQPEYVERLIEEKNIFYIILHSGKIVSAAAVHVNQKYHNGEISDCATLSEHRKKSLMKILIQELEKELFDRGIYTLYSHARAQSFGMNAVLQQLGYTYTGRLIKNCVIYQDLEDMNLWVKNLTKTQ